MPVIYKKKQKNVHHDFLHILEKFWISQEQFVSFQPIFYVKMIPIHYSFLSENQNRCKTICYDVASVQSLVNFSSLCIFAFIEISLLSHIFQ